jgi:putative SOS response-associated peptidase YedK
MCGRYALYGPKSRSRAEQEYFGSIDQYPANYNVAPSQVMPIARLTDGRPELVQAKWGLVPHWANNEKFAFKCINARSETVASSPAFRGAYRTKRRCLIPASGFYEWKKSPDGKQPFFITRPDESMLAFAGLWEQWKRPDGEPLTTYTIITTDANDTMAHLHNRMPVILRPEDYSDWLSADDPRELLKPCHNEAVYAYPVSTRVNAPKNNDAELVRELRQTEQ